MLLVRICEFEMMRLFVVDMIVVRMLMLMSVVNQVGKSLMKSVGKVLLVLWFFVRSVLLSMVCDSSLLRLSSLSVSLMLKVSLMKWQWLWLLCSVQSLLLMCGSRLSGMCVSSIEMMDYYEWQSGVEVLRVLVRLGLRLLSFLKMFDRLLFMLMLKMKSMMVNVVMSSIMKFCMLLVRMLVCVLLSMMQIVRIIVVMSSVQSGLRLSIVLNMMRLEIICLVMQKKSMSEKIEISSLMLLF